MLDLPSHVACSTTSFAALRSGCLTLLLITFLVYGLIRNMPGTPLTADPAMMNPGKMTSPEDIERWNGSTASISRGTRPTSSGSENVVRLRFRPLDSARTTSRCSQLIVERLPATLMLSVTSLCSRTCLSIPLGLWATVRSGTLRERTVSTLLYMLYSLPAFVAALYLQLLFYSKLGWLPLFGMTSDNYRIAVAGGQDVGPASSTRFCRRLLHLRQPGVLHRASSAPTCRKSIRQDYIRTARAKGVPPGRVIWHHAFRNTLIPLVTLSG